MKREKRRTVKELIECLPCTVAYWCPEGERLSDAARAGLCKMEIVGYPYWKFTKNEEK